MSFFRAMNVDALNPIGDDHAQQKTISTPISNDSRLHKNIAIDDNAEVDGIDDDFDCLVCPTGAEQTGRWTKGEHTLFVDALKKYGKVHYFYISNFKFHD